MEKVTSPQQIVLVQRSIEMVKETIVDLTQWKTDIEYRIQELEKMKMDLGKLLPLENRLDNLFK
jgi:hypothetical protein